MSIVERVLPRQIDNSFNGHRLALWLLAALIALRLLMSINSIVNTESVAVGADRIPLDSYGPAAARTVLMLFASTALGQLALTLIAFTALIRYRTLVPFIFVVLIAEHLARRSLVQSYAIERADGASPGWYINLAILTVMAVGLVLSLRRARRP